MHRNPSEPIPPPKQDDDSPDVPRPPVPPDQAPDVIPQRDPPKPGQNPEPPIIAGGTP